MDENLPPYNERLEMNESQEILSDKQERILEELLVGLDNFPNLRSLCVMGQDTLDSMKGLEYSVKLEELWICESNLKEICGLDNCLKLRKLYLYNNKITKIENIANQALLEVLWLNDNHISSVQGLDHLTNLKELNLSNNNITRIGNLLEKLINLETLHLSGNKIRSFKDLNNLVHLAKLHTLSLKDPVYGCNPVSSICNYSTYVFYHLPALKRLDSYDVDNESLKSLAEATVRKKKMYYNMRVKTLEKSMFNLLKQVGEEKQHLTNEPSKRIRKLMKYLKSLKRVFEENEKKEEDNANIEKIKHQMDVVEQRVQSLENILNEIEQCSLESRNQVQNISQATIQRLFLELETGGNVRFEDGTPNDIWYTSCYDLILSRFCATNYKKYDITGIKIHRITRIQNRVLRVAFDNKVSTLIVNNDNADTTTQKEDFRNSIEYLLSVWNTNMSHKNSLLRVLEEGFQPIISTHNHSSGVYLTNNVYNSDITRIQYLEKHQKTTTNCQSLPYKHGQLVIAKVYVGQTTYCKKGESVTREAFPEADSVFVRDNEITEDATSIDVGKLSETCCDCHTKQGDWLIFDGDLVLPEYVVDFEYLTKTTPVSPLICYYGQTNDIGDEYSDHDIDVLEPFIETETQRVPEISEEVLFKQYDIDTIKNITVLNIHDSGLSSLKNINRLSNLTKLTVSFNGLTKLHDLSGMRNLTYLDISFNELKSLDGVKDCPFIRYLDMSWNKLEHIRDEIGTLRKQLPVLTALESRHNPWLRSENYRIYTIGRLRTLQKLDGKDISEEEHGQALRHAASSRISSFIILGHSRTDNEYPRSLSLATTPHIILKLSKNKPTVFEEDNFLWMKNVTTLQLDGQGISKLSNLEKLKNLRWASFNNNNINKIEGLESCSQLEELSLTNNCITKIDGLAKLTNLKWLTLDQNNLTGLDCNIMENLTDLRYLSCENNYITSIQGLKECSALQEVFAGNNLVSNTREVFYLKSLLHLEILDLSGNTVASANDSHRMFVVYHLSSLKALNGVAVTNTERCNAREILGGRMTTDFVAEHLGHANFSDLQEIDLPNCELRTIDVGNGEVFKNLRSINLEHNNLICFGGLIHLSNLKVLCLNHNRIECVFPRKSGSKKSLSSDITSPEHFTPVLEKLEVLHLGYNGICSLKALQLYRIPNIKALFLQGNEITKVEGLESLQELRELVLDQNKIKTLSERSFIGQRKLQELHLEDNRVRELSHLEPLFNLQRLYLGMNKIQDLMELNKLERLANLFEISLVSNPITRRLMHRPVLLYRQPNILCIDGIPVTHEERTKAELYLIDHQLVPSPNCEQIEANLPVLRNKAQAPLKVTTVQLSTSFDSAWQTGTQQQRFNNNNEHLDDVGGARYMNERNRGKQRVSNSNSSHSLSDQPSSVDVLSTRLTRPPHPRSQQPGSNLPPPAKK